MEDRQRQNQAHVKTLWERLIEEADARSWESANKTFNEMRSYAKSEGMAFIDLHVLYARRLIELGEYDRSYPHLTFLRDLYIQGGITDYSFLGLRGIPPFEDYLSIAKDYLSARRENAARVDLLGKLIDALDDDGKSATREALKSLQPADGEELGVPRPRN